MNKNIQFRKVDYFRLIRAHETEEIFAGNDEKYRAAGTASVVPRPEGTNKSAKPAANTWMGQQVVKKLTRKDCGEIRKIKFANTKLFQLLHIEIETS